MIQGDKLRTAGIIAAIAGLLGGVGDIVLFSTPGFSTDLFAVQVLPPWRSLVGTLLAILAIPFLAPGYWAFSRYLTGVSARTADIVSFGGIFGVGLGNAIHGTVGTLVRMTQFPGTAAPAAIIASTFAPVVVPLYAAFYLLMAIGTIFLAVIILQGRSALPRWFVLLLPLWSNVLVLPLGWAVPVIGDLLYPSIANLSHALMFGVMTILIWGRETESASGMAE